MNLHDFDYDLPPHLIAQVPIEPRDSARLLVLDRATETISHHIFRDLPMLLQSGDLLVANDSRVLPARLYGQRVPSGGAVEILLLHAIAPARWQALVKPGRRIRPGDRLQFGQGELMATVQELAEGGERILEFSARTGSVREAIHRLGTTPLPPYIHAPLGDAERYQTIYARHEGSVAAPTAGLHFTPTLLAALEAHGIERRFVTLHVGAGTFKPVQSEDVSQHQMHAEWATIAQETATALSEAQAAGRRLVVVGTTTVRVLESASDSSGVHPFEGWTDIFLRPGHHFNAVDALITNFHLPRSTLLMLVSALVGTEFMRRAYAEAVREGYRFYSFGDAMLIL